MKIHILKLLLLTILLVLPRIPGTSSSYVDTETTSVSMTAGVWDVETEEEPNVVSGSVVINEVMWMGSDNSDDDEWIELRNMTNQPINIGKWEIENARRAGQPALMIPANKVIPANGYFLISNYPETSSNSALKAMVDEVNPSISLANSGNGHLILTDSDGNIIDQAKGDVWPEGENGSIKRSMERNSIPGDGLLAENWHSCISDGCNDVGFWNIEGNNYGTPKGENLSENDPSIRLASPLILDEIPEASVPKIDQFAIGRDGKTVSFALKNVGNYESMQYTITYSAYDVIRGIGPSTVPLSGGDNYQSASFDLATCSAGICTYDQYVQDFILEIILTDQEGNTLILTESI